MLGDSRPFGPLYPHRAEDYIAALWVTNQAGEVVHLAEFRPSKETREGLPPGQPISEFAVPDNATELTAHALSVKHGLYDGITLTFAEEEEEQGTCAEQTCASPADAK